MADLIYAIIASLDGYIADEDGKFDWAAPSQELHAYFNDLQRSVGTELYGRRMYETMRVWGTLPLADLPPVEREFAELWRATDKVVYSSSWRCRPRVPGWSGRSTPAAVRAMKAAAGRDLSIGGAALAAGAIRAGLVDRYALVLTPTIVGGGTARSRRRQAIRPDGRAQLPERRGAAGVPPAPVGPRGTGARRDRSLVRHPAIAAG